MSQTSS